MTERLRATLVSSLLLGAALIVPGGAAAAGEAETGYGYFRTVEGEVQLTTFDKAEPITVEPNYPVLSGDRLWVRPGSRVEMILPDASVLRAGDDTDLYLESLALSADNEADAPTVIGLLAGSIQLRVEDHFEAFQPTRVDVSGANVYLQSAGLYALEIDDRGYGQVVVRDGFAEVTTDLGSVVLRSGEATELVSGRAQLAGRSGGLLGIESWGDELDGYALAGETRERVDDRLAYAAAPLESNGDWVSVGGSWGWRPFVVGSWRPFTSGWWVHTPAGLTWVSSEPWGWVTTHYGVWDYAPGYGWVWFPGSYYSPAWVYWYWGPTHVAWVPAGYYSRFYGPTYARFGVGFHFGTYGWAAGGWDVFGHWTFCPVRYFGRRGYSAYWRSGVEVGRFERYRAVPRGVITTDTRSIHPGLWGKPQDTVAAITRASRYTRPEGGDLADVSDFVARRPSLSEEVRGAILRTTDQGGSRAPEVGVGGSASPRLAVTPWRPEAKGLPEAAADSGGRTSASIFSSAERDPAVVRGARIEAYRRPASDGTTAAQPRAGFGVDDRLGSPSPRLWVRPEADSGRGAGGVIRPELGTLPGSSVRTLPPSARGSIGSGLSAGPRDYGAAGDSRSPVIRQLIERMRSQEAAPPPSASSRPSSGSVSSQPSSSGSRGSVSSGSSSGGSSRGGSVSSSSGSSGSSRGSASSSRSSGSSRTSNSQPRKPPRP